MLSIITNNLHILIVLLIIYFSISLIINTNLISVGSNGQVVIILSSISLALLSCMFVMYLLYLKKLITFNMKTSNAIVVCVTIIIGYFIYDIVSLVNNLNNPANTVNRLESYNVITDFINNKNIQIKLSYYK